MGERKGERKGERRGERRGERKGERERVRGSKKTGNRKKKVFLVVCVSHVMMMMMNWPLGH